MQHVTRSHTRRAPPTPIANPGWLQRGAAALFRLLVLLQARQRQRRQLSEIDDWLLKDIGLTRADIGREVAKPFWRP